MAKKLGFGLMRLPLAEDGTQIDEKLFIELADLFIQRGFSHFDTAYVYHNGNSERAFKTAVADRIERSRYTITNKMPLFLARTPEKLEDIFEEQLAKCGVGYFDFYYLHALQKGSFLQAEKIDAFGFLAKKKREGKIKNIGFSFHDTPMVLDEILTAHPETDYVQLQINYLDWQDPVISAKACYEVALKHKKRIMAMEPLKGGALVSLPEETKELFAGAFSGNTPADIAFRFVKSLQNVDYVLSGMNCETVLNSNMDEFDSKTMLTDTEITLLLKIADKMRMSSAIGCTACNYCNVCPQEIPIPKYFALYNNRLKYERENLTSEYTYLSNLKHSGGKIVSCINCGMCEKMCPQHINVREMLEKVRKEFGN